MYPTLGPNVLAKVFRLLCPGKLIVLPPRGAPEPPQKPLGRTERRTRELATVIIFPGPNRKRRIF